MNNTQNSGRRCLRAAGAGLVLAAAVPLHAFAQQAAAPAAAPVDAMTVVRDADTGKLRAPTGQELQAMQAAAQRRSMMAMRVAPAPTLQKYHPNGARGVRLTDAFMSSEVAVRGADGSVQMQCVEPGQHPQDAHPQSNQPVTE